MAKISILIALLLQLGTMIKGFPCSDFFYSYTNKPGTNEIMGQIKIPTPSNSSRYHLKVGFNMNSLLHKEEPRLDVAKSEQEILRSVEQDRPLLYHIYFSKNQPIPILTKISFNDIVLCSQETRSIQTTNEIERIVYSSGAESSSITNLLRDNSSLPIIQDSLSLPSFSQWNNSTPILNPFQPQAPLPIAMSTNNTEVNTCGIPSMVYENRLRRNTNTLIYKEITRQGEWPWVAALFVVSNDSFKFQCGGTVLTTKHVITAGHCLKLRTYNNDTFPPSVLLVALGSLNLTHWHERSSFTREVASYTIHPDYAHYLSADSDLAILTFKTPIQYSSFIRPICLWPNNSTDIQHIVNKIGHVVGWGDDETSELYTNAPQMVRMLIVSQEVCLWSDQSFLYLTSNRTFCAGGRGDRPCNGPYSGNGLVIFDNTTRRYHLRGIISRTKANDDFSCNLQDYVVYVDVAKYIPWIQQQIST